MSEKKKFTGEMPSDTIGIADVVDQLDTLDATVDTPEEQREVERTKAMVQRLSAGVFS